MSDCSICPDSNSGPAVEDGIKVSKKLGAPPLLTPARDLRGASSVPSFDLGSHNSIWPQFFPHVCEAKVVRYTFVTGL